MGLGGAHVLRPKTPRPISQEEQKRLDAVEKELVEFGIVEFSLDYYEIIRLRGNQ